ncbi:hypothetical protein PHMEG_00037077, partial [Phytophthora megakarya]
WDALEGSRRTGVPRTTLMGWMENKAKVESSQTNVIVYAGMTPPTIGYEAGIVERIKAKMAEGQLVYRQDISADAVITIPGFGQRDPEAQGSWTTGFLK